MADGLSRVNSECSESLVVKQLTKEMLNHDPQKASIFHEISLAATRQEKKIRALLASNPKARDLSHTDDTTTADFRTVLKDIKISTSTEFDALSETMSSYLVALAEHFRQELEQGEVMTYVHEAMQAEEPRKYFIPPHMRAVAPGSHICECKGCKVAPPEIPAEEMEALNMRMPSPGWKNPTFKLDPTIDDSSST